MNPESAAAAGRAIITNLVIVVASALVVTIALAAIFTEAAHPFPASAVATASALVLGRCATRARTILRYGL